MRRHNQSPLEGALGFGLTQSEQLPESIHIPKLEVIGTMLYFLLQEKLTVRYAIRPADVGESVYALEDHHDAL